MGENWAVSLLHDVPEAERSLNSGYRLCEAAFTAVLNANFRWLTSECLEVLGYFCCKTHLRFQDCLVLFLFSIAGQMFEDIIEQQMYNIYM